MIAHLRFRPILTMVCFLCGFFCLPVFSDYSKHEHAPLFIESMKKEGVDDDIVRPLLASARRQESILNVIARPAEKTKPWYLYRKIFLDTKRVHSGAKFWRSNVDALERASHQYGVPPEIIVSIIGVETRYGRVAGNYRVLDALATLGFDYPPRAEFFRKELKHFIHLSIEQKLEPSLLLGSYAGAMGLGQFMPSSFRHYAVDFDGDNKIDIWQNQTDAIGSVANYLKAHGWQAGRQVIERASIKDEQMLSHVPQNVFNQLRESNLSADDIARMGLTYNSAQKDPERFVRPFKVALSADQYEYWIGHPNFYVITRYNHSHMYALAVFQLSQEIKSTYDQSRLSSP